MQFGKESRDPYACRCYWQKSTNAFTRSEYATGVALNPDTLPTHIQFVQPAREAFHITCSNKRKGKTRL